MNNFESRQSPSKLDKNEGWIVQVYGSNRRLLWVLEPSHGWIFLIGCTVGLLISVIWINIVPESHSVEPSPTKDSAPLQVD